MKVRAAAVALLASAALVEASWADDFDRAVGSVESHYQTKRLKIPLFGLARAVLQIARPAGVSDLHMAVFEDFEVPDGQEARFHEVVRSGLGGGWNPLVRVSSRGHTEWTAIYARPEGKRTRLMLAVYEPGEAVLIQTKVDPHTLARWLRDPELMDNRLRAEDGF